MSQAEFLSWCEYYKNFPFDDFHRYYKPSALIAAGNGINIEKSLEWLQPEINDNFSSADLNTFKAFGMKPKSKG